MRSTTDSDGVRQCRTPRRMLLAVVAGLCVFAGCDAPPVERQRQTLELLQVCQRAEVTREAPELYQRAWSQYDSAWQVIEHETQRWSFLRDYATADTLLVHAASMAREAIQEAKSSRERSRTDLQENVADLRTTLRALQSEAEYHLMRISLRRTLTLADIRLSSAEGILRGSRPGTALAAIKDAAKLLTDVEEILGRPLSDDGEEIEGWNRWVRETLDWTRRTDSAAFIVIKSRHRGYLVRKGLVAANYPVELGFGSDVGKKHAGDGATPEGIYRITHQRITDSRYYKALDLNYPNAEDKTRFSRERKLGHFPNGLSIGGSIQIHGEGGRGHDWTNGCVALANDDMDRLLAGVRVGDRVTIVRHIAGWPQ